MVKEGISTSGGFQQDTVQHINDSFSNNVGQSDLNRFFEASTVEEQKDSFKVISSGMEKTIM